MDAAQVMRQLERLGTEANRNTYRRHGVRSAQFGVSFANQGALARRVGTDTVLAMQLWATGNHDARILATRIADPGELSSSQLDAWARQLDNGMVTDAFSQLVARTPYATRKMTAWTRAASEWVGRSGWRLVAHGALGQFEVDDAQLQDFLARIEKGIRRSRNKVRDAMNGALIAIGGRGGKLERAAIATARRVGRVEVDHGDTDCVTPDAVSYIRRMKAHRARRRVRARGA